MMEEKTFARVVVTGVDIPFGELVKLMVKISLASIPALIILSVLGFVVGILLSIGLAVLGFGLW